MDIAAESLSVITVIIMIVMGNILSFHCMTGMGFMQALSHLSFPTILYNRWCYCLHYIFEKKKIDSEQLTGTPRAMSSK